MAIKVNIDGKEVEVEQQDLQLPEGYGLITPDNVPKGYYSEEGLNKTVRSRLEKAEGNVKSDLLEDESFHKKILSKYNVQLGEDGKPKGLKPTVDVDEVKQNITKELSSEYKERIEELNKKISSRDKNVIKSTIMSTINGNWQDSMTKPTKGKDPLGIKYVEDDFITNDQGNAYVKDPENGGVKYKGNGDPMTAEDYLLDEDRFGHLFADKRQRSTGTNAGGSNGRKYTDEEVAQMSDKEYEANREDILNSMA